MTPDEKLLLRVLLGALKPFQTTKKLLAGMYSTYLQQMRYVCYHC